MDDPVKTRALEIEAFIQAMCRASNCSPLDFHLVECRYENKTVWHVERSTEGGTYAEQLERVKAYLNLTHVALRVAAIKAGLPEPEELPEWAKPSTIESPNDNHRQK